MWWKIFDVLPGFVWAGIALFLLVALGASSMQVNKARAEHAATKQQFAEYQLDVTEKARAAEAERRSIELHNFRNAERVSNEHESRAKTMAAELARLRGGDQRVRDEFAAFRARVAQDTSSGNVAGIAARAAVATELYQACLGEYRDMATQAERVRVQALGLWDYIRGNSMCSTPFGGGVPEPAK